MKAESHHFIHGSTHKMRYRRPHLVSGTHSRTSHTPQPSTSNVANSAGSVSLWYGALIVE